VLKDLPPKFNGCNNVKNPYPAQYRHHRCAQRIQALHVAVCELILPYLNDEVDEFVLPHLLQVRVRDEEAHIITLNAQQSVQQAILGQGSST
jgi:hypothetical protein